MKKGILLLFAAGAMLVSCGPSADDAAADICKCYEETAALSKKAGEATNTTELMEATEKLQESVTKADECQKEWKEKYDGKVDVEAFKKALKEKDEAIYKMLDERGLF